ncbi:MAG TPA: UDP-N-acetylmuramoyl-tripeptide--D-alanyl-D-alanine ligase [Kiritimatiellia bacterium]|nr:UDP-N-acetylmuramoyl-tripeptide--D-alanyl-D-alanine ligase [Kiritimatiellia bacterium]HRU69447.1 UDP-N-acetylmuramoyl-tripeptide--D-alanyl-D-alanine ligase [Kiritimatiellia bacterium]
MSNSQPQVFDAAAFAAWAGGEAQALPPTFCGVTQDTRQVTPGCLYVALRGERFDGHDFVAQGFEKGAAAALVERAWQAPAEAAGWPLIRVADTRRALADAARAWRLRQQARVVGITGSSGKTTVKEMTAALCGGGGAVCATRGNLNNDIGLPLSLLTLGAGTMYGIFEAGTNHPGEIAALADVMRPDIALISSIGSAHIEHFGSQEAIALEKGELLRALPADGAAVLSLETACADRLIACSAAPVVTTSLVTRAADYFGEPLDLWTGRVRITERATGEQIELCCGLPGEHNASNLLLAFAAARTAGVPAAAAAAGLANLVLPGMRWSVSERGGVTVVNDAYNANPQSMRAVLRTFMQMPCNGRRIAVLGDMLELGEHTETLHRELGREVAALAPDEVIGVGPDTSRYMADEAVMHGYPAARMTCCADAVAAAAVVRARVRVGDSVLLKASRGMRLEQVLDAWTV